MTNTTIKRTDLAEAIYTDIGLSRSEALDFVDTALEEIALTLTKGEQVKMSGFGVFTVRQKVARAGRNLFTGEDVVIQPRRVVRFTASPKLKEKINRTMGCRPKNKKGG